MKTYYLPPETPVYDIDCGVTKKVGEMFPNGLYSTSASWRRAYVNIRHRLAVEMFCTDENVDFDWNDMVVCDKK